MKKKILIIGGGFAGCAAAEILSKNSNYEILLIEQGGHLGAGVRTLFHGGHPYTFGPRHFLTKKEWIYEYLNSIVPMRRCKEHEFLTFIEQDKQFYNYPIHIDDIENMPENKIIKDELLKDTHKIEFDKISNLEDYWINSVGNTLYEKFIKTYSHKMWNITDNRLIDDFSWSPKGVDLKTGPKNAWDNAISGYPIALDGYNKYFDFATKNINVLLNTKIETFDIQNKLIVINNEKIKFDIIVNTISPDILFNYCYGELKYMGRDILKIVLPVEFALPANVYFAYYAGEESYTRVTEYKKFSNFKSNSTLITIEIPSSNGRHYPMPFKSEYAKADKYFEMLPPDVYTIGRAGSYRYSIDIDDCIEQAHFLKQQIN